MQPPDLGPVLSPDAGLDVLVVGGGIVGAGAALDAVTRGLRVGLVTAGDWAEGRSGGTGTLVHGGLIDLPRIGIRAVAALRRERDLLLDRTAPHLVRRVPLLVPLTGGLPERLRVGAALGVYDAAAFSIRQPRVLPAHRQLARRAVLRLAPDVDLTHVSGAVQLYEAQVDDARLTITVVRTAMAYGALVQSRAKITRLLTDNGRVVGIELTDRTGTSGTVRAGCVVLAGSVELDDGLPDGLGPSVAGDGAGSAAVQLVLPRRRLHSSTGLVLRSAGQAVYVVPWGRHWIVGSTAAWSDPGYLLATLNRCLARPVGPEEVEGSYSTPAPLRGGPQRQPSVVVRRPGLVLVRGRGLAGYRADAEDAIDAVTGQLGGLHPPSTTRRVPLLGAEGFTARWNQRHLLARRAGVHVLQLEHLLHRYGSAVDLLIDELVRRPELRLQLPGAEDYLAVEVWYAVTHELATELGDVLARRTRIALETPADDGRPAAAVAGLMAAELGWDEQQTRRQLSAYLESAVAGS